MKALIKCGKENNRRYLNIDEENHKINFQQKASDKEYKKVLVREFNEIVDQYEREGYGTVIYVYSYDYRRAYRM